MSIAAAPLPGWPARPWRRAALWLAGLAPIFYLTYGTANWLASTRTDVPAVVFDWERGIPFLAWTIVPYWTINAFYGLSLFLCRTPAELDTHGRRLLTAQAVAVTFFVLVPLRFTFERPEVDGGLSGFLFEALAGFDKPFNQAPSLHIALLVILWDVYRRHLPRWSHPLLHGWSALIAVSVLTTYQHHFIDVPTGALLGLACLWAWPFGARSPLAEVRATTDPRRQVLAAAYLGGSLLFAVAALALGGAGLWLMWPAAALLLVAAAYGLIGPDAFQKSFNGRMSLAARLILLPYLIGARLNALAWTRRAPAPVAVVEGVRLGRLPSRLDRAGRSETIVDASAELPAPPGRIVVAVPMLDLVVPPPDRLALAADAVERARVNGPVLVACALGYSRSAAVVATWLVRGGRAASAAEAIEIVRAARPAIVVGPALRAAIEEAARLP